MREWVRGVISERGEGAIDDPCTRSCQQPLPPCPIEQPCHADREVVGTAVASTQSVSAPCGADIIERTHLERLLGTASKNRNLVGVMREEAESKRALEDEQRIVGGCSKEVVLEHA